jgi:hypothetical protein
MVRTSGVLTGSLLLLATGLACAPRRAATPSSAAVAAGTTDHCWWSTHRSTLPPDSIAVRFERAFAAVGFSGVTQGSAADTAWTQTEATVLPGAPPDALRTMWAVAYRRGDSTHYRYFVESARISPTETVAASGTTPAAPAGVILLCTAVARAAAIPGVQPPQPTGEEADEVWRRRP